MVTRLMRTARKVTYKTHNSIELLLSRVNRRELDDVFVKFPQPLPPVKQRVIWGGIKEEYFDYKDGDYITAYNAWLIQISDVQLQVISEGITLLIDPLNHELYKEIKKTLHLTGNDKLNFLRYAALNKKDFIEVTAIILYLSTVTQKGIDEAQGIFGVEWNKQPIDTWAVKKSRTRYSALFEHREAARFAFMNWDKFCKLSGQEQSMVVAHYRLHGRIEWLEANGERK